jgi:hypothetical protein
VADILAGLIGDGDGDGDAAGTENDASHPAAASGMRIAFRALLPCCVNCSLDSPKSF